MESVTAKLDKYVRCRFCLRKIHYMADPRWLLCNHAFCLSCLKSANILRCPICYKCFYPNQLDSLPKVDVTLIPREEEEEKEGNCGICPRNPPIPPADLGCGKCYLRFCRFHSQNHSARCDSTAIVDIKIFNCKEAGKTGVSCTLHPEDVSSVCLLCRDAYCERCNTDVNESEHRHVKASIQVLAVTLRANLSLNRQRLTRKLDDIKTCKTDIIQEVVNVNSKVDEMKSLIDSEAAKHSWLPESVEALKKNVDRYSDACKRNRNNALTQMKLIEREFLKQSESLRILLDVHGQDKPVEIIANERLYQMQYLETLAMPRPTFARQVSALMLTNDGDYAMTFKFNTVAKELQHVASLNGRCLSVNWTHSGELVSSRENGVTLYNSQLKKLKVDEVFEAYCQCVVKHPDGYLLMTYSPHINKTLLTLLDNEMKTRKIFDRMYASDYFLSRRGYAQLCYVWSESQIVAVDSAAKGLRVYDRSTEFIFSVNVEGSARLLGICAPNDGGVVVSDERGLATKYTFVGKALVKQWRCKALGTPCGITQDDSGFYYVACGCKIHVLSVDGQVVKYLTSNRLKGQDVLDVAVRGDKLAVATRDGGVFVFRIIRENI